jgi:hypothetical protein
VTDGSGLVKTSGAARSDERTEAETSTGGVAFVAYFFGPDGKAVPTDEGAVKVEIHELDADGNCLYRTYGAIG